MGLLSLPTELFEDIAFRHLDRAAAVAHLACSSRVVATELYDEESRLRVGSIVTSRLQSLTEGLRRASLRNLEVLRVDLTTERRSELSRSEIEVAIKNLGSTLGDASALRVLSIRLAAFDVAMERLRLGKDVWESLTCGLGLLARHQRLQTLELSSICIKASLATHAVSLPDAPRAKGPASKQLRRTASEPVPTPCGNGKLESPRAAQPSARTEREQLTFLEALEKMSSLEELVLTYDEIFNTTATMLPPVFRKLDRLRTVDLTRNHISKEAMKAMREEMPAGAELHGDGQQTFFFY